MLPLLIGAAAGAALIPFMPIVLFTQPSLETFFVVLFMFGIWPLLLSQLHGAFVIEHFIFRSISDSFVDQHDMLPGKYSLNFSLWAPSFLSKALDDYGTTLDPETIRRGQTLLIRHKAITRFFWPGVTLAAIAGVGLFLLNILETTSVHS